MVHGERSTEWLSGLSMLIKLIIQKVSKYCIEKIFLCLDMFFDDRADFKAE